VIKNSKQRILILHPLFLAIYPVLFLLSKNIEQIAINQATRPLIITLLTALILTLLFSIASKNIAQGGLAASLILALFFSYGHFHRLIEDSLAFLNSHFVLGTFWLILLLTGLKLKWKIKDLATATYMLNLVTAALLVMPVYNISNFLLKTGNVAERQQPISTEDFVTINNAKARNLQPDIYYIIVDGYGRSDILQEIYEYDNSPFITFLEAKGFYVAKDSHSNYIKTRQSIASTLNLGYVNNIDGMNQGNIPDNYFLEDQIKHSQLRTFLEQQGYQTVAFQTGSGFTMIVDADIYISYRPELVSELEFLILSSSATRAFGDRLNNLFNPYTCRGHHGNILNIFSTLAQIPDWEGPQFIFAHIMSPHPPFVFDENGNLSRQGDCDGWDGNLYKGTTSEYKNGYKQQIIFITSLLQETISLILANSDSLPIIVLQGDHGPGMYLNWNSIDDTCLRERTSILSAYYFPEEDYEYLYSSVTPVNTFRAVLNNYFGHNFQLLEDRIYFSQGEDITDKIEKSCNMYN